MNALFNRALYQLKTLDDYSELVHMKGMTNMKSYKISAEELYVRAREAADLPILDDYLKSISFLMEQGWSYRRIAQWLTEQGVPVTHNQLYYAAAPIREAQEKRAVENAMESLYYDNVPYEQLPEDDKARYDAQLMDSRRNHEAEQREREAGLIKEDE